MILQTADEGRFLDLGAGDLTHSVYSTVCVRLGEILPEVPLGMEFLKTGYCEANAALEVARQINLLRDALSQVPPGLAVYDLDDPSKECPWAGKISPVVTSCAHLFITDDGEDVLYELVKILIYASVMGVDVLAIH